MTDGNPIGHRVDALRQSFLAGVTRPLSWRRQQLRGVLNLIDEHEEELVEALRADMGRSSVEAWSGDLALTRHEAEYALDQLDTWCSPESTRWIPLVQQPAKLETRQEPLGVVLIIGPWNYPLQLVLTPLIGALAAGNCAVVKPSEVSSHCSAILAKLLPRYLDSECVQVVEGGIPETTTLLEQRFDHIFYTGNGKVARIIMTAAAKHLTPLTLELGGKSPVVVDEPVLESHRDFEVAARRVAWGKYFNAGQTCVAPDYVLVPRKHKDRFVREIEKNIEHMYGKDPQQSKDLARIIHSRHVKRLAGLLDGVDVLCGGQHDEESRYFAPTVVEASQKGAAILEEEIFGPILLIVPVDDLEEGLRFIRERPRPLVLYLLSNRTSVQEKVLSQTSSGGVCVNDLMAQMAVPDFAFGGVGASGFGAYHGDQTFHTFSHAKSVLFKSLKIDPSVRYPPYSQSKERWLRRLI